jgi:hypothetical protein
VSSGGIVSLNPAEKEPRLIVNAIRQLMEGRSNATGMATLTAGSTVTTVTAVSCSEGSTVLLQPTTANAAAEVGAGTIYVSTVSNGSFGIVHASAGSTDRIYRWVALG